MVDAREQLSRTIGIVAREDREPRRQLTYAQARALLVAGGVVVLGVVALIMYLRRVETIEVVAVLLFVPVFLAFLARDVIGGASAGVLASVVYVAMRWSAIRAVGVGTFAGLIASRVLGFLLFGAAGGWANGLLRASLTKLDLYDQVDDATSLFNARYFVLQTDLEKARSQRYKTFFSVAVIDIPVGLFDGLSRRNRQRVLRELGRLIIDSIRSIDRGVHCVDGSAHRLAVIMPETGADGARIFVDRLAAHLVSWLQERNVAVGAPLDSTVLTVPSDEDELAAMRARFVAVSETEHPGSAVLAPAAHAS